MDKDFTFSWDGANHPNGPWQHLEVLEVRGREAISSMYAFEVELVRRGEGPEVGVTDLVGRDAALRLRTETSPEFRIVHGIIGSAEELGDTRDGGRYRVTIVPPFFRATMMKKSLVYLEKTLRDIINAVLERTSWGAGLVKSAAANGNFPPADDGDEGSYRPAKATYLWAVRDFMRLMDKEARPYCVQYQESDFDFVSRLLEEEGISYHFEHTKDECILVLTDNDDGRPKVASEEPLGPKIKGRELDSIQVGARVRPKAASLSDWNWRKPDLELLANSPAGITDFQVYEHPGRFEHSKETGEFLAKTLEQRFDTERQWASGEARCRLLSAGTIFKLEHPNPRFSGSYLVTKIQHQASEGGSFGGKGKEEPYVAHFEAIRCGTADKAAESNYRPARITPRPRIMGSQTAIVTAEPATQDTEINVGGPENIGCVRVHFHWDLDVGRHDKEATSCWVRVSHLFAGSRGHGGIFHPRVGDEVIVDFLEGDPDRPLVTGRVYNGVNLTPENATNRPTYSAIKTFSSPFNGNYNMLSFEDKQGEEELHVHAARDQITEVERNSDRSVGVDDATKVGGNQSIKVTGSQSTSAASISMTAGTTVDIKAGTDATIVGGANLNGRAPNITLSSTTFVGSAGANMSLGAGANNIITAGALLEAAAPVVNVNGEGNVNISAPWIDVKGGAKVRIGAGIIEINGGTVIINGSAVAVNGDTTVKGGTVNVEAGTVNIKGTVKMNC